MDEISVEGNCQKTPLKMTIANASSSVPTVMLNDNGTDGRVGFVNGNAPGNSSSETQMSYTDDKPKYKSGSSHKPSLTSDVKSGSQVKDSSSIEKQNGFTKPKDHHFSSSSSKMRDHSTSSKDKEKHHSSSSSSHKDNHSSSRHKEHSSSSSKLELGIRSKDGCGSSSRDGSKHRDGGSRDGGSGSYSKHDSSKSRDVSSKDGTGVEKSRSSESQKVHSSSSKSLSSSSSHKDRHHSSKSLESDKVTSKLDSSKSSSEKHHHRKPSSNEPYKSSGLTSPVQVKTEISSPIKSQELKPVTRNDDDDDDTPLFSRLQTSAETVSVKREADEDDDAPLFSRLQKVKPKTGSDDDDDIPLMARLDKVKVKAEEKHSPTKKRKREDSGDESDEPLSARMEKVKKIKTEEKMSKKRKHDDDDFAPKKSRESSSKKASIKEEPETPKKGRKKHDDNAAEETKWKWWEENKHDEGVKWTTLEHKGPVFAPPYEPITDDVHFYYDGKLVKLSSLAEEVASFYAKMLDHEYTTRDLFNNNFFKDWRKTMTSKERELITDLRKCNFKEMCNYFKIKSEERKNMSKEEKLALKKENEKIQSEYGFCIIDGHKQKIGNFKIEPPGLFRGRGDHPKQGMLKKRTQPEDVIINCSKGSKIPSPPPGHKWKEVRHDNTVTWLASWSENIQGSIKYIMLNAASKLKGEKDWMKYETARRLHKCVDKIRRNYREDWKSKKKKVPTATLR